MKHSKKNEKLAKKQGKNKQKVEEESFQEEEFSEEDEQESAEEEMDEEFEDDEEEEDDNTQFLAHGQDLDLPSEDESSEEASEDEDVDSELEDYYRELGITADDLKQPHSKKQDQKDQLYKTTKKSKKDDGVQDEQQKVQSKKALIIENLITKTRQEPNYKSISNIIKIVKQIFNTVEKENEDENQKSKKKQSQSKIVQALNTEEYRKIFEFFLMEIPQLLLQSISQIDLQLFSKFDEKLKKYKEINGMKKPYFDIQKVYGKCSTKNSLLMKTFASNYVKLLQQQISNAQTEKLDENGRGNAYFQTFFVQGTYVVKLLLPFKDFSRKFGSQLCQLCMQYSKVEASAQILIYNSLSNLIGYISCSTTLEQDKVKKNTFFENCLKKMYIEFTKESKSGGGAFHIQDSLRIAQNCFVELLTLDMQQSYNLGFLYIRQLCLHLRNTRSSVNENATKTIYSWQFFNCIKIWVLALCQHKNSELSLLIHPVSQILIGLLQLSSSLKHFPFHLKIYHLLLDLSLQTKSYIQLQNYPIQLIISHSQYFISKSKPLPSKTLPPIQVALKFSKTFIDCMEVKEVIIKECVELLIQYWNGSINFPWFSEIATIGEDGLRKAKKSLGSSEFRKPLQNLIEKLLQTREEIDRVRKGVRIVGQKVARGLIDGMSSEEKGLNVLKQASDQYKSNLNQFRKKQKTGDSKQNSKLFSIEVEWNKIQRKEKENLKVKQTKLI